jgi:predicted transcriptional regulator
MKKQNQASKNGKAKTKIEQQELQRVSRDISISRRRADVLKRLAKEINAEPKEIGENAIESYLVFIEEFPHLAEAQPRFVAGEAAFSIAPSGKLYDRLDRACGIYDLERDSVVESAIGAYVDLVSLDKAQELRALTLSYRGSMDPENIAWILSRAGEDVRPMFDKLVEQISSQPFAQACTELSALRELTMHHPALKDERIALEMIAEGAARLS